MTNYTDSCYVSFWEPSLKDRTEESNVFTFSFTLFYLLRIILEGLVSVTKHNTIFLLFFVFKFFNGFFNVFITLALTVLNRIISPSDLIHVRKKFLNTVKIRHTSDMFYLSSLVFQLRKSRWFSFS